MLAATGSPVSTKGMACLILVELRVVQQGYKAVALKFLTPISLQYHSRTFQAPIFPLPTS